MRKMFRVGEVSASLYVWGEEKRFGIGVVGEEGGVH